MSSQLLAVLVLVPAAAVVVGVFMILWSEQRTEADARVALVSGGVLAAWAATMTVLAARGAFMLLDAHNPLPPIAISLVIVLAATGASLAGSPSLRSLLTNQRNLALVNVWRLEGLVFLLLMLDGQVPALWALPAGIGDVIVGVTAPAIAGRLQSAVGRRRAIVFHLFGLADLVVAVSLGIMTNPGPAQVFLTAPTSALLTRFPLALVPTFLVPLAFTLHVASLWQLFGLPWAPRRAAVPAGVLGGPGRSAQGVA